MLANARYDAVRGEVPRQTFISLGGMRMEVVSQLTVYARADGDPRQIMAALRQQVARVDPNCAISDTRTLDDQLDQRLRNERMLSFLSSGFALLATLLAIVGLYAVLAFVVARRTREVGIRVALGAGRLIIVGLVLREMLLFFAVGIGVGLVTAFAARRYVQSQLFGVDAADPVVFAAGGATLLAASFAAALVPAWRATAWIRCARCGPIEPPGSVLRAALAEHRERSTTSVGSGGAAGDCSPARHSRRSRWSSCRRP